VNRFVSRHWLSRLLQACLLGGFVPLTAMAGTAAVTEGLPSDARGWLARVQSAAVSRNYQGTMVFTTGGIVSSSRVAHFCVGDQVYERIEALDGKQRQIFRFNQLVHTVWPKAGVAVIETRNLPTGLPSSTQSVEPRALDQYELKAEGAERVAGREAYVFVMAPRDDLRFAQRMWADQETGLMLRSEVIGPDHAVLESSGFSEIEIGVPARPETVLEPIRRLEQLRVLRPVQTPTQLDRQGWSMTQTVPGFHLASCVTRTVSPHGPAEGPLSTSEVTQALFSDGLTQVSMFIERFDSVRHRHSLQAHFGATHSLSTRRGEHWITVMGDVPPVTLQRFVEALERRP
jgi:sigma-E factor negative regulatory protein RseB